ncbi:MmcB family DNA repair protein [Elioraea sp.]|uniref:MmcB family DNA repair protein n=1 Tax=Elioraea sp. TaxID=2185103 RepID=UPI0025B9812E|nr:MmcB family DNA repair protein [Elioraea sp.]
MVTLPDPVAAPARTAAVTLGAARLLGQHGLAVLREVKLADGRRADLVGLAADGTIMIVEVKSCARDFLTDGKWQDYLAWCDRFCFAVDRDFPLALLPAEPGLIIADAWDGVVLREPPSHPLAPARRRAITLRLARLGALRAEAVADPAGQQRSLAPD